MEGKSYKTVRTEGQAKRISPIIPTLESDFFDYDEEMDKEEPTESERIAVGFALLGDSG